MSIKDRIKNYCNLAVVFDQKEKYPVIGYYKRPYNDIYSQTITDRIYWYGHLKCYFSFKKYVLC